MRYPTFTHLAAPLAAAFVGALAMAATGPVVPKGDAARIEIGVSPDAVSAGGEAEVTVRVVPAEGVKINRYPRIRLSVASLDGVVQGGDASAGSEAPPDPDHMDKNYFKKVEPVTLTLKVDPRASAGKHEVDAMLRYSYCVAASGYCAPVKTPVKIAVTVR